MVGMTRAHIADPHIAAKVAEGREARDPPLRRRHLLPRPDLRGARGTVHPQPGDRARGDHAARHRPPRARRARWWWSAPARPGWRRRGCRPSAAIGVVLFEAAHDPGGQVRLAARTSKRRSELIGIADWRAEQLHVGWASRCASTCSPMSRRCAGGCRIVVIVATGGLPETVEDFLDEGADLAVTSWDILSGDAKIAEEVLLFDDNGGHPGMQAAEAIAEPDHGWRSSAPSASSPRKWAASTTSPTPSPSSATASPSPSTGACSAAARGQQAGRHHRQRLRRLGRGTAGRPGGGRARHPATRRSLLFALKERKRQSRRGRLPGPDRRPAAGIAQQSQRPVCALPHRRRRVVTQRACCDLRCAQALQRYLGTIFDSQSSRRLRFPDRQVRR